MASKQTNNVPVALQVQLSLHVQVPGNHMRSTMEQAVKQLMLVCGKYDLEPVVHIHGHPGQLTVEQALANASDPVSIMEAM